MARAETVTWLSLDRYAQIMGINPLFMNQVTSSLASVLCADVWYQAAWQRSNQVSREDLAQAIHDAEQKIASYVGYNLLPDWLVDERHQTARPNAPELYNTTGHNVRFQRKSITADYGYVLHGGQKAKTLLEAGSAVTYSDEDGDGYDETATTSTATTLTDTCEIRLFFPASVIGADNAGADKWEIRPVRVTISSGTATIKFRREQLPDPELWDVLNPASIDGDVDANFLTVVDIYRVYNDPQQQAQFIWEEPDCATCGGVGCAACEMSTQYGCLGVRDNRLGFVTYHPADWNAVTSEFDAAEYVEFREPDRLRLWYRAGWQLPSLSCPVTTLDPYWERPIAYLATALLDRPFCDCNNASHFADWWREDLARVGSDRSYQLSPAEVGGEWGTQRGAIYAWKAANANGRRIA